MDTREEYDIVVGAKWVVVPPKFITVDALSMYILHFVFDETTIIGVDVLMAELICISFPREHCL